MPDRKPEFPTPWRIKSDGYGTWIEDSSQTLVCEVGPAPSKAAEKRLMRRIVAAVNAAEGKG